MFLKLLILLLGVSWASCRDIPLYRKDYFYSEKYNAFYKLHWDIDGLSWNKAFVACDKEDAKLFYPTDNEEWTVVQRLAKTIPFPPNSTEIIIGFHDNFEIGEFITVDGHSVPKLFEIPSPGKNCVFMDYDSGKFQTANCDQLGYDTVKPFVCKRDNDEKTSCPTTDKDYEYEENVRKCYKAHNAQTWNAAVKTCFMEGGSLAVIESSNEANVIFERFRSYKYKYLRNPDSEMSFFVGFYKLDRDFYTIKGDNLNKVGYNLWYNRNNGYSSSEGQDNESCGAIQNNHYTTVACGEKLPFICEMDSL